MHVANQLLTIRSGAMNRSEGIGVELDGKLFFLSLEHLARSLSNFQE